MKKNKILEKNKNSWEVVFNKFKGWCSLPNWGPYGAGSNISCLGNIKDAEFAEICCGSGHSIKYLLDNGAKFVHGIDFSKNQIKLAKKTLEKYSNFNLKCISMEEWNIENLESKFDYVFSVYGIGWCSDLTTLLLKVNKTLKPGGKFVFSWEHPMYQYVFELLNKISGKSYFDESDRFISSWAKGNGVYLWHRKIGTWIKFLRDSGFDLLELYEPSPTNIDENIEGRSSSMSLYYNKELALKIPISIVFVCKKR